MSNSEKQTNEPRVTDLDAEEEAAAAAASVAEGMEGDLTDGSPANRGRSKQNRLEKKNRKAISRLGLKPIGGVVKVTIKKSKHLLLSIVSPEVFKSPTSEIYVIFGVAKIDDGHSKAAQAFNQSNFLNVAGMPDLAKVAEEKEEESTEDLDVSGIQEKDIELVMAQGSCTRAKAIAALKENNNDIVEAIMAVSST